MINIKTYTVKDGKNTKTFTIKIDTDKPKCYREGFQYKFNTEYLKDDYRKVD